MYNRMLSFPNKCKIINKNHDILLNKLYNYGIRGLPWIGSKVACQKDIKLLKIMNVNQKLEKYFVESQKGLY